LNTTWFNKTSATKERKQQKETIEPIEIEKLQENNKWVIMEDERRWTYVVDDNGSDHATWMVEGSKMSESAATRGFPRPTR